MLGVLLSLLLQHTPALVHTLLDPHLQQVLHLHGHILPRQLLGRRNLVGAALQEVLLVGLAPMVVLLAVLLHGTSTIRAALLLPLLLPWGVSRHAETAVMACWSPCPPYLDASLEL